MTYDFDTLSQRRNTGSYKWDTADKDDVLPMWVADMDFPTAPPVLDALRKRVEQGIFGYVKVPQSYYDALTGWFARRHGWKFTASEVIYTTGVVPAISAIIKALTKPGEGVILQTPAYNCFFSSIRNNACRIVENPLVRHNLADGTFTYAIDFEQLGQLAADPSNTLLVLCNPHNPTGRVWTREELTRLSDICRSNGVTVVSDEIHCELVHPGFEFVPYATVDPEAVVTCSPSKAFNIAGLQIANIVCRRDDLRARIDRAINDNEVCDVGPMGVVALEAAYNHSEPWLEALNAYLFENYRYLCDFIKSRLPMLKVCRAESTYLAWVDVTALGMDGEQVVALAMEKEHLQLASGLTYGDPSYIRINYATQRQRLVDGLGRLAKALS